MISLYFPNSLENSARPCKNKELPSFKKSPDSLTVVSLGYDHRTGLINKILIALNLRRAFVKVIIVSHHSTKVLSCR